MFFVKRSRVVGAGQVAVRLLDNAICGSEQEFMNQGRFETGWIPHDTAGTYKGGYIEFETETDRQEFLTLQGRANGWYHFVASNIGELPNLRKFIQANTGYGRSSRSPYTNVRLDVLAKCYSSPGALERLLHAVIWQCNRFLKGYGQKFVPNWHGYQQIARAMEIDIVSNELLDDQSYFSGTGEYGSTEYKNIRPARRNERRISRSPAKIGKRLAAIVLRDVSGLKCGKGYFGDVYSQLASGSQARELPTNLVFLQTRGLADFLKLPTGQRQWILERVQAKEFESLHKAAQHVGRLEKWQMGDVVLLVDPDPQAAVNPLMHRFKDLLVFPCWCLYQDEAIRRSVTRINGKLVLVPTDWNKLHDHLRGIVDGLELASK